MTRLGIFPVMPCALAALACLAVETPATRFATRDVVVAESVLSPVDGDDDDSVRIQAAIDAVAAKGGGVVFLNAGAYRIQSPVTIGRGVTLRGDYSSSAPSKGTVLEITAGRDEEDGTAAFSMVNGSGLVGLTFFYPEQSFSSPTAYPWTVRTALDGAAGNNQTVMDCTFVNSWQAIRIGPETNECHTFRRLRICALKTGFLIDMTTDIGRIADVTVSPSVWAKSGFANAPGEANLREYLLATESVGALYRRSDWEYIRALKIDDYRTGIRFDQAEVPTNGVLTDCDVTGCTIALELVALNWVGVAAYHCRFVGIANSVLCADAFDSVAQFHTCSFGADFAGGVRRAKGALIVAESSRRMVAPSAMEWPRPAGGEVIDAARYGVTASSADNTEALQRALDAAGKKKGGGTVYVGAGYYRCAGTLTVPAGVELRGSSDVPHHTQNAGTVLLVTAGKGDEKATPFVSLSGGSGIRGIGFWYPEQPLNNPVPYPWAVRSLGPGCWLADVNIGNAWLGVDFGTNASDGHRISYLSGCFFKAGLVVANSSKRGWVEDIQFNPHYALRRPAELPWTAGELPGWANSDGRNEHPLYTLARKQLRALVFQNCADEHVTGTFVYAARDSLVLRRRINAAILIHGADTCCSGVKLQTDAKSNVRMSLGQFVPLGADAEAAVLASPSNKGKAYFAATQIWPRNPVAVNEGCGTLVFDMFNSCAGGFIAKRGKMFARCGIFRNSISPHMEICEGASGELKESISEHGGISVLNHN